MIKNNRTPPSLQLNLRAKLWFTSDELQEFRCVPARRGKPALAKGGTIDYYAAQKKWLLE
jgi:hypothetical protein